MFALQNSDPETTEAPEEKRQVTGPAAIVARPMRVDGDSRTARVQDAFGRTLNVHGLTLADVRTLGGRFGDWIQLAGHGTWASSGRLVALRVDEVRDVPATAATPDEALVQAAESTDSATSSREG